MGTRKPVKTIQELRAAEAKLVQQIMAEHAPVWEWLTGHLGAQLAGLVKLAGRTDIQLTEGTRAVINGRAALIQEILDKPAKLLTILEDTAADVGVVTAAYTRPRPPAGAASKV